MLLESRTLSMAAYGALFVIVLPAGLFAWATALDSRIMLPKVDMPATGIAALILGASMLLWGMWALWRHGGGMPMNVFPPPRYVSLGIYRFLAHPIYTGFCLICAGASIYLHSAAGFWVITPITILACTALIVGYEAESLHRRFPEAAHRAFLHVPEATIEVPSFSDRISVLVLSLGAFVLVDVLLGQIDRSSVFAYNPISTAVAAMAWAFIVIAILFAARGSDLRRLAFEGWCAAGLYVTYFLALPHFVDGMGLLIWVFLAARVWTQERGWKGLLAKAATLIIGAGLYLAYSLDVFSVLIALTIQLLAARADVLWRFVRDFSERIANSWREWRIGPVRIINHGAYAALGAFIGLLVIELTIRPQSLIAAFLVAVISVIAAALWAQVIEGSSKLLRPYGYYGCIIGCIGGAIVVAWITDLSAWLILASFSLAAPWAQAAGRLRCLVQGCCHGRPTSRRIGIRVTHPSSRICRIAHLDGVPLHPTQTYSILWNIFTGVLLFRLWFIHCPLEIISGIYLILNGLGRFGEEAYRGEPQTPVRFGLRLYQWMAVSSVLTGILFTLSGTTVIQRDLTFQWALVPPALLLGAAMWCAYGVDFPLSNRRFARLT